MREWRRWRRGFRLREFSSPIILARMHILKLSAMSLLYTVVLRERESDCRFDIHATMNVHTDSQMLVVFELERI